MSRDPFLDGLLHLLTETFEGAQQEWSWYLDQDRNTGLFATLNTLTAAQASRHTPLGPSVAGQAAHLHFHLAATLRALRGEAAALDFARSWAQQEVTDEEWVERRAGLHDTYEGLKALAAGRAHWDPDEAAGLLAALTHAAYHLSAIRQAAKLLDGPPSLSDY